MTLPVREYGPADAPSIVLIHGGGVGTWMWDPQIKQLSIQFHCLVPTLPGHDGTPLSTPFTIAAFADMIIDLIKTRAHGGRAHLVGLSLGAQTAVAVLAKAPELVDHAVLSGCLTQKVAGAGLLGVMTALTDPFKRNPGWVRANMKQTGVPEEYFAQFAADSAAFTPAVLTAIFRTNMDFGLPNGLERVTSPTLVVVGEQEKPIARTSARRLAAAIPSAKAYVSAGVNHGWNLQAPDRFSDMIADFIAGRPLPAGLAPLA